MANQGPRGKSGHRKIWLIVALTISTVALGLTAATALASPARQNASQEPYATAYEYTVRYYPRWLTYTQQNLGKTNIIAGPIGMSPEYGIVVAINDDTLYAQGFVDLSQGPQILTLPPYPNTYSILVLDVFGNILDTPLQPNPQGGAYALFNPSSMSQVPSGITQVELAQPLVVVIIRADKYSSDGTDNSTAANEFRKNMQLQSAADWKSDPTGGKAYLAPLYNYTPRIKTMADEAATIYTTQFLSTLQKAMADPSTAPLTPDDKALIDRFNTQFEAAKKSASGTGDALNEMIRGARDAHAALIDRWRSRTGPTNWIHFDNIGHWGTAYLDRAALTEYIQYGNDAQAGAYWHAFVDGRGVPLDGSLFSYQITFSKQQLPQVTRFWSVTAYTPEDVELVANPLNKYVVASYTPGLVYNSDGGVTIYASATQPSGAPQTNWLPVPSGPFNLMLRAYGPQGAALDGTYVPPKIEPIPPKLEQ